MGFDVYLHNFEKRNNSTKRPASPTGGTRIQNCIFKEGTSMINPRITLALTSAQAGDRYNYAYVPSQDRFYWVRDIVYERGNIYTLVCETDLLATYRGTIGGSGQYVLRAQYDTTSTLTFDTDIHDSMYPLSDYSYSANSFTNPLKPSILPTTERYVVTVTNGSTGAGYLIYSFTPADYSRFLRSAFSDSFKTQITNNWINPIQYISSVKWYPQAPVEDTTPVTTIRLGWFDLTSPTISGLSWQAHLVSADHFIKTFSTVTVNVPKHPQQSRGHYLNNDGFASYDLYAGVFGKISIKPATVYSAASIDLKINVDYSTGDGVMYVETGGRLVAQAFARVGVPIPLVQTSTDFVGAGMGAVSTIASAATSAASGNFIGAATGAVSGAISVARDLVPQITVSGSIGSRIAVYFSPSKLQATFVLIADEATNASNIGRPLCKWKQINTLSGYVQTKNATLYATGRGYDIEKICQIMDGGFIYE